jgi:hypothetical protein
MSLTLLDIAKLNSGVGFNIIEENILLAPELRLIPMETITGTEIRLTVRTDLPSVAFRRLNEGTPRSKSKYEERIFQCADLSHQVAVDKAIVDKAIDKGRVLENHMSGAVEAAFRHSAKQWYYGTSNDAKGFPGLIAQMLADSDHEVDATGASAKSSVWFVRIARETLQFIGGNGSTITMAEEWKDETVYDASGNPYQALTNWLNGAIGCRLANKHSVVRIKNLGTAAGKTLTDTLMYSAYEKFTTNLGAEPTHIFMTPRSQEQLRASRTNTGSNEKGNVPTLPSDWDGIPIVKSSAISNAETI